jgi:hypothetical protein
MIVCTKYRLIGWLYERGRKEQKVCVIVNYFLKEIKWEGEGASLGFWCDLFFFLINLITLTWYQSGVLHSLIYSHYNL